MIALSDFRYAVRLLTKRPGFTALTTTVMATGIGLSVYLLVFFNTVLSKDLPFRDGENLYHISASTNGERRNNQILLHDYFEIRTNLRGVKEFGAYRALNVNVAGRDGARRYSGIMAEANIFELTRTKPILGRGFAAAENLAGAPDVVVIGYDVWQNLFGGSDDVLEQTIQVNGASHRVIGVMPEGYFFPSVAEVWLPMREDATKVARDVANSYYGLAQLEEGAVVENINRQLSVIMQRIEQRYPKTNNGISAYMDTLQMTAVEDGIAVVRSMQVTAVLILLLAAINVGNLLFSRAVERGKETAIRVALGAPRYRLISQMLWESTIICTIGGLIGLFALGWGLEITQGVTASFSHGRQAFWWSFGVDAFTVKMILAFILGTIVLTGLLPAWKNSGGDFNAVLRDGTRGALGKKAGRLNRALVVSEIFVSMAILIAAGVVVVASYNKTHEDNGAKSEGFLTGEVILAESVYDTPEKQVQFAKALQSRLEVNNLVGDVAVSTALPSAYAYAPLIAIDGREYGDAGANSYPRANYISLMPGSLEKLEIDLREGRYFGNLDDGLEKKTIIVTDSFVAKHFPGESGIGKRVRVVETDGDTPNWLIIVGVVEHVIIGNDDEYPSVFRPFTQAPSDHLLLAIEMKADPIAVTRELRTTLASVDPEVPAFRIETYDDKITRLSGPIRFISGIFMLFAAAAVVLAASGIYGVMSNTINQRTQEIGVKQALGAQEKQIKREFMMVGFKQLLWGGIPGLLAGSAMGFAMAQVFGLENGALAGVAILMASLIGSVVMLATYFPTKRALEMEPSAALRYE